MWVIGIGFRVYVGVRALFFLGGGWGVFIKGVYKGVPFFGDFHMEGLAFYG